VGKRRLNFRFIVEYGTGAFAMTFIAEYGRILFLRIIGRVVYSYFFYNKGLF